MNVVNIRERFKEARQLEAVDSRAITASLFVPIFEYPEDHQKFTPEEIEFLCANVFDEKLGVPVKAPFESFILAGNLTTYLWGKYKADQWWFFAFMNAEPGYFVGGQFNHQGIIGKNTVWVYRNWKLVKPEVLERELSHVERLDLFQFPRMMLAHFLLDVMNPANAVVQARPNKPGKSAAWQLARTHYLIVPKRTARHAQAAKGCPKVDLKLSAHWRRGHLRRLMSDKFTHKRGQTVFVRHSWVGPTEWVGLDKKIYKVMA